MQKEIKISQIPYKRLDKEQTIKRFDQYKKQFSSAKTAQEFLQVHKEYRKFVIEYLTTYNLVFIRNAINVKDKFYANEKDYYDEVMPELEVKRAEVNKCYIDAPFVDELKQVIPSVVFDNIAMQVKANSPLIIEDKVAENKLCTEYSNLVSSILVDYDGKQMPMSAIWRYIYDSDRTVRKRAMTALGQSIEANKDKLDSIYDQLVKVRTAMGRKLGFENYSPLGYLKMQRNCYNKEDIAKFRQYVLRYIVPLCEQIYERARVELKLDRQYLYDEKIFTAVQPQPQGTPEEIFANGSKMYHQMDKDMGELFDKMVRCEAFDYMSRANKWGGGFCDGLPQYQLPFILSNFNGSSDDIETLTHEFGHAYEASIEFGIDSAFLSSYGMETAEVHSMSMEFLTYPWINMFYGEHTDSFKQYHIASALVFLPYGTIVDYFQQLCYDNPNLTPKERCELWLQLENRFRPWTSVEGLPAIQDGRLWQRQSHIFEDPFYYIDYCLAQVMALQFLVLSIEDYKGALNKYKKFLSFGGTKTFLQIIEECELMSPFEEQTFAKIVSTLKKILKLK